MATFYPIRPVFFTLMLPLLVQLCAYAQPAPVTNKATCLRAIYRLNYKLDSAETIYKSEQLVLRINNGLSCFRSLYKHVHDSTYASLSNLPITERGNAANKAASKINKTGISESYYSIFKEPAKDLVFYHDNIAEQDYQYQEKAPLFQWKIMPAKQVIMGYECQQALTIFGGRTWEAWFTREIPVSEGPYKFYGLPGLIVKVRDTHNSYAFELLSFESRPRPFAIYDTSASIFSISPSAPLIKKAKFKQAKLNSDKTFLDRMASWGNYVSDNMRSNYAAKLKRRNNPLELQ
jgi:GLPGLI family protein